MQPDLALTYGSRRGNGLLGVGFAIEGLSEIKRCGKTLATDGTVDGVDFDNTDRFCLDGQKLVAVSGVYGADGTEYRTEHDSFARIISHGVPGVANFDVWTRDGHIRHYTYLNATRAVPDTSQPYALYVTGYVSPLWVLEEVKDRSGNSIRYSYNVEQESAAPFSLEYSPALIEYTLASGEVKGRRQVAFNYEDRPDPSFAYESGVRTKMTKRLTSVVMSAPNPATTEPVWSYEFGYGNSPDSQRTVLEDVHRCDADGACLWGKMFGWEYAGRPSYDVIDLAAGEIPDLHHVNAYQPNIHVLDANGDGKDDIIYRHSDTVFLRLSEQGASGPTPLSKRIAVGPVGSELDNVNLWGSRAVDQDGDGSVEFFGRLQDWNANYYHVGYQMYGWNPALSTFGAVGQFFPTSVDAAVQLSDFDGDGLPDLQLEEREPGTSVDKWVIRMNTGSDFGLPQNTGVTAACARSARALDIDGDGRGDLHFAQGGCVQVSSLGFDDLGALAVNDTAADLDYDWKDAKFVDVNGDGLKDALYPFGGVRWNTGKGFGPSEQLPDGPYPDPGDDNWDGGMRVADVNGDGREDVITFWSLSSPPKLIVYLSRGDSFTPIEVPAGPGTLHNYYGWMFSQLGDFNGDGLVDIVEIVGDHFRILQQKPGNSDVIYEVRDEFAEHARDRVFYSPAWSDSPKAVTCSYPQRCLKQGLSVVREHDSSQGEALAVYRRRMYSYEDPRVDYRGRGFLGFAEVREWDPERLIETITTFDNQTNINGIYPYAGLPATTTEIVPILEQPSGPPMPLPSGPVRTRVLHTEQTYQLRFLNQGRSFFVSPGRWESKEWEEQGAIASDHVDLLDSPSVTVLRRRSGASWYDDFGNILDVKSITDTGVQREVVTTYDYSRVSDWLIGLPLTTEVTSFSVGTTPSPEPRLTSFVHDVHGLLSKVNVEPNHPDLWRSTRYVRSADGVITQIVASATGEPSRHTYVYYDDERVFPRWIANDYEHFQWLAYHPAYGVLVGSMDPNGVQSHLAYDGFGRIRSVQPGGGARVKLSYRADLRVHPGHPRGIAVLAEDDGGGANITYHDELGRVVEEVERGFDEQWVHSETRFDMFGRVAAVNRPGIGAASSNKTLYTYDTLDRLIKVREPNNATTRLEHSMFETRRWDAKNNESYITRDIEGRVDMSADLIDGHEVRTIYTYGPFDMIEQIHDTDWNVTLLGYDKLGRRTSLDDPDQGAAKTFEYNGFGEVLYDTDALDQTIYSRDLLGRVYAKQDADGVSEYVWDQGPHSLGKLSSTKSADGTKTEHLYDQFGRATGTFWFVGGEKFAVGLEYDQLGRVDRILYPDVPGRSRYAVKNVYNTANYLSAIVDVLPNATNVLWHVLARNVDGALSKSEMGNGIVSERGYNAQTGRLETVKTTTGAANYSLEYTYDLNGNVQDRIDTVAGRKETFTHDALDRVKTWKLDTSAGLRNTLYDYDDLGNLTHAYLNGQLQDNNLYAGNGKPHALTGGSLGAFFYDAKGRQHLGSGRTIDYTAFDLPRTITQSGKTTGFSYDASNRRVRKTAGGDSTVYIAGLYERRTVDASVKHVFYVQGETGPVAQVVYDEVTQAEDKLYIEEDALGSVGVVSDKLGQEVERVFFDPFGKRIAAGGAAPSGVSNAVKRGFTGHAHDDELGLIDMKGRVYDAVQRRFLTPDPHVSDPLFGQSYNRYSYVLNSPLKYTDPTGFDLWPTVDNCGKPLSPGLTIGTFDLSSKAIDRSKSAGDGTPSVAPAKADDAGYTPPTGALAPTKASLGDLPTPASAVAPAAADEQVEAPSEEASTGGSWRDSDVIQGIGGAIVGLGLGVAPFGSVVAHGLTATKVLDQGTRAARIGRGIGEIVGGFGQIVVGGIGVGGGSAFSLGGVSAIIGIPVIAVAAGTVTSGAGSVAAGIAGLGQALSSTGSGTGNPQRPSTGQWAKGSHASPQESLTEHFGKHGAEVGAKSESGYLKLAEDFKRNMNRAAAKRSVVDGFTKGVIRYRIGNRYIDLDPNGGIISFGGRSD